MPEINLIHSTVMFYCSGFETVPCFIQIPPESAGGTCDRSLAFCIILLIRYFSLSIFVLTFLFFKNTGVLTEPIPIQNNTKQKSSQWEKL